MRAVSQIHDLIEECAASFMRNEMAVFCGAGLSVNSGLPLASQFVHYILRKLPLSVEDFECLSQSRLPFEAFIRLVIQDKNDDLLGVFDLGRPNANHILFARLVRHGLLKLIVTTNFDLLFEKAFAEEGLETGREIAVVVRNPEFGSVASRTQGSQLIKIHGTIADKESVAITLRDVASKELSEPRKAGIEYLFLSGPHKRVLVLGYSCSDIFDLSPQIASLGEKSNKEIIIIEHARTNGGTVDSAADEGARTERGRDDPFRTYSRVRRVSCDTDVLVAGISRRVLGLDPGRFVPSDEAEPWRVVVDRWVADIVGTFNESIGLCLAGSLLNGIAEFRRAVPYHERACRLMGVNLCDDAQTEKRLAVFCSSFGELGDGYLEIGMHKRAIEALTKSLELARLMNDEDLAAARLGSLGRAYCYLGDYESSLRYYGEALSIFDCLGSVSGRASQLTGLGHVHLLQGNYDETIRVSNAALILARELGDKKCEANNLGNMGIALRHKGQLMEAMELHFQAVEIALAIGDKQSECQQFGNVGIAMTMLGKYHEAVECHTHAVQLAQEIGLGFEECHALGNLGVALAELGDNARAVLAFQAALDKTRLMGDKLAEARCLFNLGISQENLGLKSSALDSFRQALNVYRTVLDLRHPEVVKVTTVLAGLDS